MLESVDGYRLCGPVRNDLTMIDPAGEFVQAQTIASEVVFKQR